MKFLSDWQVRIRKEVRKLLFGIKDKLDFLSSPYFVEQLEPIGNNETREIFAFDIQIDEDCMSESSLEKFSSLDDCIDQSHQTETFAIANLIRG